MFRISTLVIVVATVLTATIGSMLTSRGMAWYATIARPAWTPPGSVIGMVWTGIFILTAIAATISYNRLAQDDIRTWIVLLFIVNAVLNIGWSWVFFNLHTFNGAIVEMLALEGTVLALIYLLLPREPLAALLLVPYALWVGFATYLTVTIADLNR